MNNDGIGDEIWRAFIKAEQEVTLELQEVASEANTFEKNQEQTIFAAAIQMLEHEKQQRFKKKMKGLR